MKTQIFKKVKLFGAGHPQLPDIFKVTGTAEAIHCFLTCTHGTTHAKYVQLPTHRNWAYLPDYVVNNELCENCEKEPFASI